MIPFQVLPHLGDIAKVPIPVLQQPLTMNPIIPPRCHVLLYIDAQVAIFLFQLVVDLLELLFVADECLAELFIVFGGVCGVEE